MINKIRNKLSAIKNFVFKNKKISAIILIILLGCGYWTYSSLTNTNSVSRYVLATVEKGTIISSISGTGQVSASDQVDIKPDISGKITYINITKNKEIKAGTLLAQIESRDAQNAVEIAENDLASAKLSLTDINGDAKDALDTAYDAGLDALTTTYKNLASIKSNLDSMFLDSSYNGTDSDINYYLDFVSFYDEKTNDLSFWTTDAEQKYTDIQKKLDTVEEAGWTINKNSQSSQIESAVNDTYTATKTFLDLIRQTSNLTQRYQKISGAKSLTTPIPTTTTSTQITQLSSALSLLVSDTATLLTVKSDIIAQKETYSKVSVNTQAQNISIQKYENALLNAKDTLTKYYVYAPIDGIISTVDSTIKVGDTVSSGTALGSIVTKKEIIEISLNEVDTVKIKTGQKATITFDALPDVTVTGSVIDVDTVGTVSSGVVSYGVRIALDITDSRIKPGMSGSVNIITETKQNVLSVPSSTVKTKNGAYYVLVISQKQDLTSSTASQGFISTIAPTQKTVEIGVADDINTEITSGLSEGDQVVVRTITSTATTTSTTSASGASRTAIPGLTGGATGGGGNFRPGN